MVESSKKRADSVIEVCLQFEDGSRKSGNFNSTSKISTIFQDLCPEKGSADQHPLVIYMRKEVFGQELETTNLKKLGLYSGKAMFRLMNKNDDEKPEPEIHLVSSFLHTINYQI